ncbi:MAG: L-threonylcarbamoyladenylate synthase [Pseudomonadota bacterium]
MIVNRYCTAMVTIIPSVSALPEASRVLREGRLVAVPTETVYGLAADASNADAVAKIYTAKGRPNFNPLIVHVADIEMAQRCGAFDDLSLRLAETFWPGPLTLIVPLRPEAGIASAVTAGLDTIALRQPVGVLADLARELGNGIAAPSANSSGRISATSAQHVRDDLGDKVDLMIDGGDCAVGVESTIVKVVDGAISVLRAGGVSHEQLSAFAPVADATSNATIESPGQLLAHYAPRVPLRMNAKELADTEAQLAFGASPLQGGGMTLNLSATGDLDEAAHNLFAMMKALDDTGTDSIAVQPIPERGIGVAINDRLRRAAHGSRREGDDG